MKIKYIPGLRPTPMLIFYTEPNLEVYQSQIADAQSELNLNVANAYTVGHHHYWNPGAYLIFDDNLEVLSHVISHFPHFLYLLRTINKPLNFNFSEIEAMTFKKDLDSLDDELKIID